MHDDGDFASFNDSDFESSDSNDDSGSNPSPPTSSAATAEHEHNHNNIWADVLHDVRDPVMAMWSALRDRPAVCDAACAYLRKTPDGKPHKGTGGVRNLALDMARALRRGADSSPPLPFSVWDLGADDLATLMSNLADAHRKERVRLCAPNHALALGRVFGGWSTPDHFHDTSTPPLSYLMVVTTSPQETVALFTVQFGPGAVESTRLIAKIHFCKHAPDRVSDVNADAVGPRLRPYADLVPTLLRDVFVHRKSKTLHRCSPRYDPPGLVLDAVARRLLPASPLTLPPHAYAALWPAYDTARKHENWQREKQEIATAWFTEGQLSAALGVIAAYEAADIIAVEAPRYGRTDPLGTRSLRGQIPAAGVGMLRSDGTGPLSLLQTAQVKIVESAWRVPLNKLPDDAAGPLALAMWQRACAAQRARDGTVSGASCLLDVARYWGIQTTEAQERQPEWLCQDLIVEALARSASLGRGRAVPVAWETTDRPLFPSKVETNQWFTISMDMDYGGRDRLICATPLQMRAHMESAFAAVYGRSPGSGDEPLVQKATDLAVRANALASTSKNEGGVCASHQAIIALGVVRGGLDIDTHVLSDPYTATDVFNDVEKQRLDSTVHAFRRYRPPASMGSTSGDAEIGDGCNSEDSDDSFQRFNSALEFL